MRTLDELQKGCSDMLKALRIKHNLSKTKMAAIAGVDAHTWDRYESGKSAPSIPEFICIFDTLGDDVLANVLDFLYPETYVDITKETDADTVKSAMIHYCMHVATDHMIREMLFLIDGEHGSNIHPQLELFTMIDHLPMHYRYAVAEMVSALYNLADSRGELILEDHVMPDMEVFEHGLEMGKHAAFEHRNSYSTAIKDKKV